MTALAPAMRSGRGAGLTLTSRLATHGVDVTLDVPAGAVLALLGPNGSGKSTTLGVAAGLVHPDAGRVTLGEKVLLDVGGGIDVPPHRRGVALLRQDALLFPHLSVADNVAFAPRAAGASRRAAAAAAGHWLAQVGALDLAARRPGELSGGQAQRVALARALAADPHLLLLDEPFAALDVRSAPELRGLVRRVLLEAGRTAVVVTHDVLDVVALADHVAVLEAGEVVERGPVRDVLAAPRSAFAAGMVGTNLLTGTALGRGRLALAGGPVVVGVGEVAAGPAVAVCPPRAVALYRAPTGAGAPPAGSPRNVLPAAVLDATDRAGVVRVRVALDDPAGGAPGHHVLAADVTPAAYADLRLEPGARVRAVVKAQEVALHPGGRGDDPAAPVASGALTDRSGS